MSVAFDPLSTVSDRIRRGAVSSRSVTEMMLERIAALDDIYRSYRTVLADRAMERAEQADQEIAAGQSRGPLHGVPVALKDVCDTTFAPTAAGTMVFQHRVPAHNATVVDRLERGGAVILGKLGMTDGAFTSHHPAVPAPLNPWGVDTWVGASSTGSGVATAAGLCYGSLGSGTGGSIAVPCATCGLTGIKPTWGRVSRYGIVPLAASLDHVGPMTRSAEDAAVMLGVIAGADPNDPTALQAPVPDYRAGLGVSLRGLTVGIDRRFVTENVDAAVIAALGEAERVLAALGCRIREVTVPATDTLVRGWAPICAVEAALAHRATYPARAADYGPDLAALIERGRASSAMELAEAAHDRLAFSGAVAALFEEVDLVLLPTLPDTVPSVSRMSGFGQEPDVLLRMLRFTTPFCLSGSPTITLPAGIDEAGLPLSLQLVGRHLAEELLCRAGYGFQQVTDWHTRRPPALA